MCPADSLAGLVRESESEFLEGTPKQKGKKKKVVKNLWEPGAMLTEGSSCLTPMLFSSTAVGSHFSVYKKLDICILMQNLLHLKGSHERKVLLYRKKMANMANFVIQFAVIKIIIFKKGRK